MTSKIITNNLSVFYGAKQALFDINIDMPANSVTALIGLIGLMGIVVRNGIIYISYAEELRREHGHSLEEAAISSAKRRMRPIFLTSAAAAVGVVPDRVDRIGEVALTPQPANLGADIETGPIEHWRRINRGFLAVWKIGGESCPGEPRESDGGKDNFAHRLGP